MDQPKESAPAGASRHGGRLIEARRLFPCAPEPFIDLSTGINPLPYPVPPIEPSAWTRLPEPEEIAALEDAAAKACGVPDASKVVSLPGTQLLISLLPRLFPQDSVASCPQPMANMRGASPRPEARSWRQTRSPSLAMRPPP
jgi:histidinol-phosphate/aromatic aminotransferase/cobyric acid decarboxylase-like protein